MIEIKNMNKTFHLKTGDVRALEDVSVSIADGTIYGVIGYSGAGKSTLVRCINLLEVPDSGSLKIGSNEEITMKDGIAMQGGKPMGEKQLNNLRRGIGMIFQHFNLLDRSTVFDNVAYPLKFTGMKKKQIAARVRELLELVGLSDKINVYPSQLSGGQKQRVAIARALANNPAVLLSDEATSALDPEATEAILALLKDLNRKLGLTIVLITHEMAVIKSICQRVAVMENGRVVEEGEVYDVFADPKTSIAARFVASASPLSRIDKVLQEDSQFTGSHGKLVKLTFRKDCAGEPLITMAARKFNINFNVVLANVEILQGASLGGMIGLLEGTPENISAAIDYLTENHVITEEIADGRLH